MCCRRAERFIVLCLAGFAGVVWGASGAWAEAEGDGAGGDAAYVAEADAQPGPDPAAALADELQGEALPRFDVRRLFVGTGWAGTRSPVKPAPLVSDGPQTIHVSPDGDDSNPGTFEEPVQTPAEACARIPKVIHHGHEQKIYLDYGDYTELVPDNEHGRVMPWFHGHLVHGRGLELIGHNEENPFYDESRSRDDIVLGYQYHSGNHGHHTIRIMDVTIDGGIQVYDSYLQLRRVTFRNGWRGSALAGYMYNPVLLRDCHFEDLEYVARTTYGSRLIIMGATGKNVNRLVRLRIGCTAFIHDSDDLIQATSSPPDLCESSMIYPRVMGKGLPNSEGSNLELGNAARTGDGTGTNTAIGFRAFAEGGSASAFGRQAHAMSDAVAIGRQSVAENLSVAIGRGASAEADSYGMVALGSGAEARGGRAVAIGRRAAAGDQATAIGRGADAHNRALALGRNTEAQHRGVALGSTARAQAPEAIAIGPGAQVSTEASAQIHAKQMRTGATHGHIPDDELEHGEYVLDADEDHQRFIIRYKDSDGTIQTGTIDWD